MSTAPKRCFTVAEYMEFEKHSQDRHEYYQGEIFAMTGGSDAHNCIAINLVIELGAQLKGKPCRPYGSETRVKVEATGLYTYPDVSVACSPKREEAALQTLLNPKVLIEVLSPSTVNYDRLTKLEHYQQIPSVLDILFIAQDEYWIEHFTRRSDGEWLSKVISGSEAVIELESIQCRLTMTQIYENVEISSDSE